MFPFNPWRRWTPKIAAPTGDDFEAMLAAYRFVFAACLFLFGLFALPILTLLTWAAVKDEARSGLFVLGIVVLAIALYQWLTWRFLRKNWSVIRACRIARLAELSESASREIDS